MPSPPRADEAGGLYHALNRGNLRADIFRKGADWGMFINSDTRAFRSRTMTTSSSFAATLSETPCEQSWWIALRTGVGDHCGDGNRSPSLIQSCCRRGRFPDRGNGWNGLTIRSQRRNWTPFACPLSEAVHWGMMSGWNQSPHASTLSQSSVRADGNNFDQKWIGQSKKPEPFDSRGVLFQIKLG